MVSLGDIQVKTYSDRTASDLYVDKPLSNISIKYTNSEMLAGLVVKEVPVTEETGYIWSYGLENFAIKDLQRADKTRSKQSSYSVSHSATYALINYALSDVVTEKMRKQQAAPMQVDMDTAENLTDILLLNKEYLLSSALFNTGSTGFSGYTETLNAGSDYYQWNDYTNSAPMLCASYAKGKIHSNSGVTSKISLIVGYDVWTQLENHPDVLELIKYTQMGVVTQDIVAKAMQIDNLYVGRASYNSANEGQTATLASVWGKYALFMHTPDRVTIKTSACAATLHGGRQVRKWNDPYLRNADVIEVEEAFQHKLLSARSGYLFSTAVA